MVGFGQLILNEVDSGTDTKSAIGNQKLKMNLWNH